MNIPRDKYPLPEADIIRHDPQEVGAFAVAEVTEISGARMSALIPEDMQDDIPAILPPEGHVDDAIGEPGDDDVSSDDERFLKRFGELLPNAQARDPQAQHELFGMIYPLAVRYARSRLGSIDPGGNLAQDAAQEACLAFWKALPRLTITDPGWVRGYILGIIGHKATDRYRAISRHPPCDPLDETLEIPTRDTPESIVLASDTIALLPMLEKLTPLLRGVVFLRVIRRYTIPEVASALNRSPAAIAAAQHRALNRLRTILSEPAGDTSDDTQNSPSTSHPRRPSIYGG
jgi:RNA polymerase sigma-70 factor (ECF subfamily)